MAKDSRGVVIVALAGNGAIALSIFSARRFVGAIRTEGAGPNGRARGRDPCFCLMKTKQLSLFGPVDGDLERRSHQLLGRELRIGRLNCSGLRLVSIVRQAFRADAFVGLLNSRFFAMNPPSVALSELVPLALSGLSRASIRAC